MKTYESLVDALADLKTRGYDEDFDIERTCLYCDGLDLRISPGDCHVDEVHRFEENSNPGDNAVLYAISSTNGVKGTLVDAYGTYAEHVDFEKAQ